MSRLMEFLRFNRQVHKNASNLMEDKHTSAIINRYECPCSLTWFNMQMNDILCIVGRYLSICVIITKATFFFI